MIIIFSLNIVLYFQKHLINTQLLDYYETGYLDELYSKWFNRRVKCISKPSEQKISIGVDQYKGVFLLLALGVATATLVLFVEQILYKWTIPFLRKQSKESFWKSLKLMFISQVYIHFIYLIFSIISN